MTRFLKEQQQKLDLQIRDESKKGSPLPEKSSGEELFLCLDGLAVTEGYADVALAVDRNAEHAIRISSALGKMVSGPWGKMGLCQIEKFEG